MGFFSNSALRPVKKIADKVEALSAAYEAMTDGELKAKTAEFKERHQAGESLDALLPEVFAQVREASWRVIGLKHFYEQILGGIVLHQGNIAEMKTGEGKTLVATLPAVLNAIPGKGVHVVTVNEYLAKRDSEWMGKVYRFLGYKVGLVAREQDRAQKQKSYGCDIIYSTNNELGFDYLRDNMVVRKEDLVQRELYFSIVDEVDSILIDEARTPLIISGHGNKGTDLYRQADQFVRKLKPEEHFEMDEKLKAVNLTEDGVRMAEKYFKLENLTDIENTEIVHHINQALKAHELFIRDREYVVQDGEVIIVDEFTGRLMVGRRYSDGLHQAIEAKEGVKVERESKTLATITFQNFFRMYNKLSGMTGTAKTEEDEFNGIYNLNVVEIPTHMPMIRKDMNDTIYATKQGKFAAVVDEIARAHETGQPVLVGTVSVADNEYLSSLLVKRGIKHELLNAKNHMREAQIIAQAGKKGAVTIATNMAGRGTDIILGGNSDYMARNEMRGEGMDDELIEQAVSHAATDDPDILAAREKYAQLVEKHKKLTDAEHDEVIKVGGLHIIGTERHESRRIDNQLRGRAGRQGDPGSSIFFIALEDDLMRLFGGDRIKAIMERMSSEDDIPLQYGMLSKQIENAQKRIEGNNFNIRKHVLDYDDVMNQQRNVIYTQRRQVLMGDDISDNINSMKEALLQMALDAHCPKGQYPEEWDWDDIYAYFERVFGVKMNRLDVNEIERLDVDDFKGQLEKLVTDAYSAKEKEMEEAGFNMRAIERMVLLRVVDSKWMDHIDAMDQFRRGIGLRALGQRNPITEYRMEGFEMFDTMVDSIRQETIYMLYHIKVQSKVEQNEVKDVSANIDADGNPIATEGPQTRRAMQANANTGEKPAPARAEKKVGRNEPCPCGSGKKYKNCCGKND
ncbi:preprotein translocase subunit SecA [Christensenellaceae bacterium OttesenSCG-928-K19]|nr:preprotein translocase subunit SecA [Christensenellaceae bacterium OttesenSCG-928-K19]